MEQEHPIQNSAINFEVPQPTFKEGIVSDNSASASPMLLKLILFWIIGCVLSGKSFAYFSFGKIFITEFVLGCLIIQNLRILKKSDFIFLGIIAFYIGGGLILNPDWYYVIKDISILYYLLFLRFFPRNFPQSYLRIAMFFVYVEIFLIFILVAFNISLIPLPDKYGSSVSIVSLFFYRYIKRENRLSLLDVFVFMCIAVMIEFKTLIILFAIMPLIKGVLPFIKALSKTRSFFLASLLFVGIISANQGEKLLKLPVELLSSASQTLGGHGYATDTASWRVRIWERGLRGLVNDGGLIFGTFPGYNFINVKFLNLKSREQNAIASTSEGAAGVNRLAHNFVIQIIMKSGFFGLFVFFYYFFSFQKDRTTPILTFQTIILILALSAGLLEIPSHGGIFYCFLIALAEFQSSLSRKTSTLVSSDASLL